MAERKYVIVLRNETDEESQQTTASTQDSDGKAQKPKDKIKSAAIVGTAYGVVKSVADKIASPYVNTIALRTGYEEKQQHAQFVKGIASQAIDTAFSIGMGIAIGGGVGAVIGAVKSLGNQLYNYAVRQQEVAIQRDNENNQIFLNQIRMGAGANREGKTR